MKISLSDCLQNKILEFSGIQCHKQISKVFVWDHLKMVLDI